jgi:subtilisin family serine protease/subtilisin-like proprotein convertase family protein
VNRPLRAQLVTLGIAATLLSGRAASPLQWELREPSAHTYTASADPASAPHLLRVIDRASGRPLDFSNRLLVRTLHPDSLPAIIAEVGAPVSRTLDDRTAVIALGSPTEALRLAASLATDPRIEAATPSRRRFNAIPHSAWGPAPNDPYFREQWHLEPSRGTSGAPLRSSGLEFRSVWPRSTASSVVMAIVDDGVDATHPDLAPAFVPELARNWFTRATNAAHMASSKYHGTAVAGLAAARGNNGIGASGAAPNARVTGWVIFDASNNLPETDDLAASFEYRTDVVPLQNHSWGNADLDFLEPYLGERLAISNAVTHGRNGLGTIVVRSAGNTRFRNVFGRRGVGDANLDGFANEPGAITVAGLRRDGFVASYSAPGACLLVAAPGGEVSEGSQLFTLDPVGDAGNNRISTSSLELANYLYGSRSAAGTSFATPLISGLAALVLDVQPGIGSADLQRLFALASWPLDLTDPDLSTNRAGLALSHNVGFGTPDPGQLLGLAQRPAFQRPPVARQRLQFPKTLELPIPDDGLRVIVEGPGLDTPRSFAASGGTGMHPDVPTARVPLVDAGTGASALTVPVAGAAALLQRLPNEFADKIRFASDAGAAFAIIANSDAGNGRLLMLSTDAARIPAVLVGNTDGATLRSLSITHPQATARLELTSARVDFTVTNTLSLDWAQVRIRCQHPRMGDLRVTLRSPTGNISVLHRAGTQTTAMISEWWYASKRHLLEPSAGTWTLAITDQATGMAGVVSEAELILSGIPITDTDNDGLDDAWETTHLGTLGESGADDTDGDGWSHAAEAFLGQSPRVSDRPLTLAIHPTDNARFRLSWPSRSNRRYRVERATTPAGPWTILGEATFPGLSGSWFHPESASNELLRVIEQ